MTRLHLKFLSPLPLNRELDAQALLDLWLELLPGFAPERYGNYEPVHRPFSKDAAVTHWTWPFLAERTAPRVDASVFMRAGPRRRHSFFKLSVDAAGIGRVHSADEVFLFLLRVAEATRCHFAYADVLDEALIASSARTGTIRRTGAGGQKTSLDVSTETLERFLPNVYWATVFGAPYVSHFGRSALLEAPAFNVVEIPETGVALRLSAEPSLTDAQGTEMQRRRESVKTHLNNDSFFNRALHPEDQNFSGRTPAEATAKIDAWYAAHRYRVPRFEYLGDFEEAPPSVPVIQERA